ncbi:Kunitz/Bovine pancreatic trypsin inhibitor domain family protein [Brugia pahangi]
MFVPQNLLLFIIIGHFRLIAICCKLPFNNTDSAEYLPKVQRNVQNQYLRTYHNIDIRDKLIKQRSVAMPQQFSFSFDPSSQVRGAKACSLPQQIGNGPYRIPRWYYNSVRMRCELFYWSGCCANGNNFPSIHNCKRLCEVDPCKQDLDQGHGKTLQARYYFNKYAKVCEQFDYRGIDGNRNNFESLQECQQQCPEALSPCSHGSSTPQIPCFGDSTCGVNQFCHFGQSQITTVCCNRSPTGDRCHQLLNIGLGNAFLQRWHFNTNSKHCEPFIYRGLQGNENNFLNQNDCQMTCFVNPCAAGEPYQIQGNTMQCSPAKPSMCPNGYYCHIGAEPQTTVCCPNLGGNACEQQVDQGQGNYQLQRWYWNIASQRCMPFVYAGLKGTQNNFLNQEICDRTCYAFENPCLSGKPQQGVNNRPLCSSTYNNCAITHWCHIGAIPQTTVCCPGKVEGRAVCKLPLAFGSGDANLKRWYFDQNILNCIPFSYGGMHGNQNNFLTQQQCQQHCPGFTNPCRSGNPEMDSNGHIKICSKSLNSCSSTFWCHIGAQLQTTLCCPDRVEESTACQLPLAIGHGGANLQRWYFNNNIHKCVPFIYDGLHGNQNNFLTQQECEQICPVFVNPCALGEAQMGRGERPQQCISHNQCANGYWCHVGAVSQTTVCCPGRAQGYAICQQPVTAGMGNANLQRWYYDVNTRQCLSFTYHGTMGNENNFISKKACQLTCPAYVNVCPQGIPLLEISTNQPRLCAFGENSCGPKYWCHLGLVPSEYQCCPGAETNSSACKLPLSVGIGGAPASPVNRWYYDAAASTCKTFEYNGRKGNQNNFISEADCAATCTVFVNPCDRTVTLPLQTCSNSQACPSGTYCHYGSTSQTTICCPFEGNRCSQPMARGIGSASLQRWYYNSMKGICEMFTYNGIHGNANNFLNKENCEIACRINPCPDGQPFSTSNSVYQTCVASTLYINGCPNGYWCNPGSNSFTTVCCPGAVNDPCNLPMVVGEGNEKLQRYYYDAMARVCRVFTYHGMKGNQNNFLSQTACQLRCRPLENPCIGQPATTTAGQILFCSAINKEMCPVNFWCHIGSTPETSVCCPGATNPCSVPLSPGSGNADLSRWYYSADDRECLPFQYNGIRGNQNNFLSQIECSRTCPG